MSEKKNGLAGTVFQDEKGEKYTILSELNAGSQGKTCLIEDKNQKKYVLKLIFEFDKAKENQIRNVMKCREKRRATFDDLEKTYRIYCSWPLYIVNTFQGKYNGGYIMDYFPLGECVNYEHIEHDFDEWDYEELCRVSEQLCRGFSGFHNAGYCYKDVSKNNILFDMKNQKMYIIDLDNTTLSDGKIESDVWGTPGFMAPEISRKEVYPNEESDFFSIAVILFYIWSKGHPFEGKAFVEDFLDLKEYMKNPVFIFHPTDKSNSAETDEGDFEDVVYWWNALPEMMKKLFTKAFVDKLEERRNRISVTQWIARFQEIKENHLMKCPKCGKSIAKDASYCGFCGEDKPVIRVESAKKVKPDTSTSSIKKAKAVQVMEVRENGQVVKKFAADKERDLSGNDLSGRLSRYKTALRFEIYNDNGKKRMVLRNMIPYLNWRVVTNDDKSVNLPPRGRVAIDRAKKIILESGVSLTFAEYLVEE